MKYSKYFTIYSHDEYRVCIVCFIAILSDQSTNIQLLLNIWILVLWPASISRQLHARYNVLCPLHFLVLRHKPVIQRQTFIVRRTFYDVTPWNWREIEADQSTNIHLFSCTLYSCVYVCIIIYMILCVYAWVFACMRLFACGSNCLAWLF